MQVFVYGTLCDRETTASVLDEFSFDGPARLQGLRRVDGTYPTLAPGSEADQREASEESERGRVGTASSSEADQREASEESERRRVGTASSGDVNGRILVTDDVAALDRYEGVDSGLYVRIPVPHTDRGTVQVYVGDPDELDAPATWPGTGPFRDRVRAYVADADVVVSDI